MRKSGRITVGVVVAALLVACTMVPQAMAKTKLTFAMYGDTGAPESEIYSTLKQRFEAQHPEYELEILLITSGQYNDKILTMIATGVAPDVFLTTQQTKVDWVEQGLLLDVTSLWQSSKVLSRNRFFPAVLDAVRYQGKYYGTPWGFAPVIYFGNVDLMEQAGLGVPQPSWTLEDFKLYAKKMTNPDSKVFGTTVPVEGGRGGLQWAFNFSGHDWVDETGTKVLVNDRAVESSLQYWLEMAFELQVTPTFENRKLAGTEFITGHEALYEVFAGYFVRLSQAAQAGSLGFRWTMLTYPKAPVAQKHFAHGHLWSIARNNPRARDAMVLLEWLGSPEAEMMWAETQRTPPQVAEPRLWEAYFRYPDRDVRQASINFTIGTLYGHDYVRSFQYWPGYSQTERVWKNEVGDVFEKKQAPKQALERMVPAMQAALDAARRK